MTHTSISLAEIPKKPVLDFLQINNYQTIQIEFVSN